ncbi:MAG: RNA ligase family protein [Polyangiales bacterium]
MEHRPYPKVGTGAPDGARAAREWVATEKVHGANLVVATDGERCRIGKRKAWLEDGEPFFGWKLLRPELEAAAREIHRALGAEGVVRVYGELYGGAYPHPDVTTAPGVSAIQTGVWYAPEVRFAAFDILVERDDDPEGVMLSHRELETLAPLAGLDVVPLLGRGSRADLDALPVRYPSRMSALLGLPEIAGNFAEGFVLKADLRCPPALRAAYKRKIPEFDEQRFDESAAFDPDQRLDLAGFTEIGRRLINGPRVDSARSKLGDVGADPLIEEVVLDVLVDLEATYPRAFAELGDDEEALRTALVEVARRAV